MRVMRFVDHPGQRLARPDLVDRTLDREAFDGLQDVCVVGPIRRFERAIHLAKRAVRHGIADEPAHGHARQLLFDQPELGDRFSELTSFPGVGHRVTERGPDARHVARAELHASEIQDVEGHLVTLTDRAEHVLDRHFDVVEHQRRGRVAVEPELDFVAAADDPHRALDQEAGKLLAVDLREQREQIGELPVGDPHLLAVEQVMTAIGGEGRGGARRKRVGSRLRLGERVRRDQLAAGEPAEITRLLLGRSEIDERQRADRRVRAERSAERGIDRNLFADVRRADQIQTKTAVCGRDFESQQVECGSLPDQLPRQVPVMRV